VLASAKNFVLIFIKIKPSSYRGIRIKVRGNPLTN
jgi:hypothetical protein